MNGLRSYVVLLIGLSLFSQLDAGVMLNDGERAMFRLEFESVSLSSSPALLYDFPATKLNSAGPEGLRDPRRPFSIFDGLGAGLDDVLFASQFRPGAGPASQPSVADNPTGLIMVSFQGADLNTDPATSSPSAPAKAMSTAAKTGPPRPGNTLAVIPTPASLILLGLGLIGLGYHQRRKILLRGKADDFKPAAAH